MQSIFFFIIPISAILIVFVRKKITEYNMHKDVMSRALAAQKKKAEERNRPKEEVQRERLMNAEERRRAFIAQQRRLMSDSLRYDVMKRDGFRCKLCGATAKDGVKLHVDHIIPVSRGGKTEMSNLRTLCERCNLGKGAKQE